ncbi:copper chaperone PCu(A)C [Sedimentitalea todarodis]|uniref:Copper chaperone PCu(A)C n=1 Tax=Sedimentitalea todarodis TaxID=1631240 RepID=A0ABU3V999_9RHOB|nr:copper chaperone PCu(A)C [Sedimentitalea todarodis]MDU9002354.1 copper chaperone PCu(A)C [Sedimentitalea todarodis]
MKAAKPIVAIAILMIVATAAYLLVSRAVQTDLLLTNVTAAPIEDAPGSVGVFMTIRNSGGPDRLVSARSIVAQRARLDHAVADAGLAIPADSEPALAPDGAFILMDGIGGDLQEGRMIPVTLRFETAGEFRTQARLVTPQRRGKARDYGLLGLGDICTVQDGEPAPSIAIEVEPDGDGWTVRVLTEDFTFANDAADGVHVPGTGHGHLYLSGLKLQRLYEPEARIGALPPGKHQVRVTLNTNDHRAYVVDDRPVSATAEIIVR